MTTRRTTRSARWAAVLCLLSAGTVVSPAPTTAVEPLLPLYVGLYSEARDTEPPNFDVNSTWLGVDPNTGEARFFYHLRNGDKPYPVTSDLVAYIIVRVGALEGFKCVPLAEIVTSTGTHETIVRAPGADVWPEPSSGRSVQIEPPAAVADPLLEGVTLDCYVWRVKDQDTLTLRDRMSTKGALIERDPYDVEFELRSKPRARVELGVPTDLGVVIEHFNWTDRSRLYDRLVVADPAPGLEVGTFDGDLGDEPLMEVAFTTMTIPVTVTEEGEHAVEVTVNTANGVSASQTFAFFVPFTPPDWSDSLAGRHVFEPPVPGGPQVTEPVPSLWFLDDTWAYFGQPSMPPDCSTADPNQTTVREGCVPYWFDDATDQVQVGDWRGTVFGDHILFDGFDYTRRATQPAAGATYGLQVRNHLDYWCLVGGVANRQLRGNFCNETTTLTLRKDGIYSFRQRIIDSGEHVTRTDRDGRYVVTAAGVLKLRANGELFAKALLSLGADPGTGTPKPATLGLLWDGQYFAPVD